MLRMYVMLRVENLMNYIQKLGSDKSENILRLYFLGDFLATPSQKCLEITHYIGVRFLSTEVILDVLRTPLNNSF